MDVIKQQLKQLPGMLWTETQATDDEVLVDVIAHADAVNKLTQDIYLETAHKLLADVELGERKLLIGITKVRVESGVDSLKREVEELEGVIGVHLSPLEWTEDKKVKKIQVVINVDETKFQQIIFQEQFTRIAKSHSIRVALKVDLVQYRPKIQGLII